MTKMSKDEIKTQIFVKDKVINVIRVDDKDYISLTDLARYADNDELSSARAISVFKYITENSNIDPSMIKHSGRGEYNPIADNSTAEGRSLNRRVEIKIYNTLSSF
jgi:chemotaxis protein MotB